MFSKAQIRVTLAALWLLAAFGAGAAPAAESVFTERAERAFQQARRDYQADTNRPGTNALRFARACFNLAIRATNDTRRAELGRLGADACRRQLTYQTNSAAGHYYLAMNLGELAQAEAPSLTAYRMVHEVEREFLAAAELDVHYDHAGPARSLGELYFQAPGWPLSIGSRHKAREWFERAAMVAPEFPGNLLDLAEAQLKWRQREELQATLTKLEAAWPAAQAHLTGEDWEPSWAGWEPRRNELLAEFHRLYGTSP